MKILFLLLLSIPTSLFGQESFREEYVLKGTTILTGSDRNALSEYVHGYRLADITSSECEYNGRSEEIKEQILSITITDSSYVITANIKGNCAHAFLGEIEIENDSIISLIAHGYGSNSTCACCFGITYTISFDHTASKKVKYIMIDGIKNTLIAIE
ncbi:MAG: hypothetical protein HRT58_05850 [Crocinitomicaceae bacterium]|nr:hypothetical protein [Flavobacteriales bacterium]NQZ35165.1 hypothetical protein [Crocinitomicaceae bacterium]